MFYRPWKALPVDPDFPSDLKELGYHVDEESDEIRSIENPKNYFKFFINKNQRYNDRQRFAMNEAIEKVVHARLEKLGLEKTLLPLGTTSSAVPNVPIFVSADIKTKSRVILIIGEKYQDLGIIAHRVLGGRGGVAKGSMVSVIETLQSQPSSATDPSAPGFILANTGQYIWNQGLGRCLTEIGSEGAPRPSAVHGGPKWYNQVGRDRVAGNENIRAHIGTIFESVVPAFVDPEAGIDIIAMGDGADALEQYLDWSETWKKLAGRINCLAILGGYYAMDRLKCSGFREFLRENARVYATAELPLGVPISGPDGNHNTRIFTANGAPVFSGGEPAFVETLLIHALPHLASWLREVALTPNRAYRNDPNDTEVAYSDPADQTLPYEPDWSTWQKAPLHEQPPTDFGVVDPRVDISGEDEENVKLGDKSIVGDLDGDDRHGEVKQIEKTLRMMELIDKK